MKPTPESNVIKSVLALSMGDYNGIGPEIILKAARDIRHLNAIPLAVGHHKVFEFYSKGNNNGIEPVPLDQLEQLDEIDSENVLPVLNVIPENEIDLSPGQITKRSGKAAMIAVEQAARLVLKQHAAALVTAPISKEAISKAGYQFPGHTEFLAAVSNSTTCQMILAHDSLRVALATIHVPLSSVSRLITGDLLLGQLKLLNQTLMKDFGCENVSIAVLGLNPHAGDGGVIGNEEETVIKPAIQKANQSGIPARGPFAADGFFGSGHYKEFDAILAMYHDQGLVPFKTLSFGKGVNVTAGLPVIRTSPDHGTGFDIAGLNRANASSFTAAAKMALEISSHRDRYKSP